MTYIETTIEDNTQEIVRIEDTIERTVGQGFCTSKFFTLGLFDIIYQEERSIIEVMCGLSTLEHSHYKEQVSTYSH
jgi:hypothetical protein